MYATYQLCLILLTTFFGLPGSILPIGPQLIMLIIIVMSFAGGPSIEVVVSIMVDNLYLMLSMGIAFCVYWHQPISFEDT